MKIVRENAKKKILLIFAVILYIHPLCTTATEIGTFSHDEEKYYGPTAIPRVKQSRVYDDGTVVARIVRRNADTSTATKICYYEMLSLRIIHPNGTVEEKDITLDIPQFNYCFTQLPLETPISSNFSLDDPNLLNLLDYQLIRKNHILITYYDATDPDDIYAYEEWGMIIDFDGNVLDKIPFGFVFIDEVAHQLIPDSKIQLNINREKGFLRLAKLAKINSEMEWQQYRIEPVGTFKKLTDGTLEFSNSSSLIYSIVSTVDGYAVVYANTTNNLIATNPLLSQGQLFFLTIGHNRSSVPPLLLYQTPLPNLIFPALTCDITFAGVGQVCILTVSQKDPAGLQPENNFFVKVNFLSSGSVINITVINSMSNIILKNDTNVNSLPFGGYLLTNSFKDNQNSHFMYGFLFSNDDDANSIRWEFPEPEPTNMDGVFQVLHNNTLLVAQRETSNSWQFQVIDLPKFVDRDQGYSNLNVKATIPAIQSSINLNIPKISIDFYDPVELSNGKLSIYQVVDNQYLLRQSTPGILCSIENDGKTVSADVLESTFSKSKGNYFIKVDNDFVRDKVYKEPLLGIRENVWRFTTKEKKDIFAPRATGLLRLTSNGTRVFDNLSQDERHDFFNTLLEELSVAVPVSLDRLVANRFQLDESLNEKRYLIPISIDEISDEYDNSAASIIKLIDAIVKNKDQSPISSGRLTGYLDESYGFILFTNLWERYKIGTIGLISTFLLLIILLFFKNHSHIAILQLGVIIFCWAMNILFVSYKAKNIPVLYIPSVVLFTMPIPINTALAFYIISQENTRPKFHQWFIRNKKNATNTTIFTVLACADIEALSILQSYIASFQSFQTPFSRSAESRIFWGTFLKIFIEELPRVIIQVYYGCSIVNYDIIPFFALIFSVINLLGKIVDKLIQGTIHVKYQNVSNYDPPDDMEYFDDTNNFGVVTTYINTNGNLMIRKKEF